MKREYQIDASNVEGFGEHLLRAVYVEMGRMEQLTHRVRETGGVYVSEAGGKMAQGGVYYDKRKGVVATEEGGKELSGTLWKMLTYEWKPMMIMMMRGGLITCGVLPGDGGDRVKSAGYVCRKISDEYRVAVLSINLSPTRAVLVRTYGVVLTTAIYNEIPFECISSTSTDHELKVKARWMREWSEEPLPVYAKGYYRELTKLNKALAGSGRGYRGR